MAAAVLGGSVRADVAAAALAKKRQSARLAGAALGALTLVLLLSYKHALEGSTSFTSAPAPAVPIAIQELVAAGAAEAATAAVQAHTAAEAAAEVAAAAALAEAAPGPAVSEAGASAASAVGLTAAPGDDGGCPAAYERMTVDEIRAALWKPSWQRPYLFGAQARPACTNCKRDALWAHFCQYRSHGPTCPEWLQQSIVGSWLERGFELPLTLTPCDLWRHIRGRTLFMMGDSMMLDFFKALRCFLFEFWPGLEDEPFTRNKTLETLLTDSTVRPHCGRLLHGTRVCYIRTDQGKDFHGRSLPALLQNNLTSREDLLIANFGLHHGDQKEYQWRLWAFVDFYKRHADRLPRLFWQQTLAQHFGTPSGEYGGGSPPFQCRAIQGFKKLEGNGTLVLEAGAKDTWGLRRGLWRNAAAGQIMAAAGFPLIQSFNESVPMWRAHKDNGEGWECTHPCHPSMAQASVAKFYLTLEEAATTTTTPPDVKEA
ncbi:hypothetical protein ABPG75_011774 [Micractinium tetrahymenae]